MLNLNSKNVQSHLTHSALISFYYNTPNNTLPIFWASTHGWNPLLPRTEAKKSSNLSKNENLFLLIFQILVGGKCFENELTELLQKTKIPIILTIKQLETKRYIRIKADEFNRRVELTVKGNREVQNIFENYPQLIQDGLNIIRITIQSILKINPKHSLEYFNRIKKIKNSLINLMKSACNIGDIKSIIDLGRTVSWLLLKELDIDIRIELGRLILSSFDRKSLETQYGYINIDDLGWSYIINNENDKALDCLNIGIDYFWQQKHSFGLCQGWRHLQGLKGRLGNFTSAVFGMRIVYGSACSILHEMERLEMQSGILRGIASITKKINQMDISEKYLEKSIILAKEIGDEYHATTETKFIQEAESVLRKKLFEDFTLYLVRHPSAPKNAAATFGRHMLTHLTKEGESQVNTIIKKLSDNINIASTKNILFYSATSKVTHILSNKISKHLNAEVIYEKLLDPIHSGDLTGYSEDQATRYFPDIIDKLFSYRQNKLDGYELSFPNGESVRELTLRLTKFLLEKVYFNGCPQNCIVVGHNSSITAILNILTAIDRWPVDSSYKYFEVPVGSIMKINFDNNTHAVKINFL